MYAELEKIVSDHAAIKLIRIDRVRPNVIVNIDGQISKLKNQLTRAKRAYLEEIDTVEEFRENKARIETAIRKLEERRVPEDSSFSAVDFREQCRNAFFVLKPDASMDEKAAVAHALIEKVESNSPQKNRSL